MGNNSSLCKAFFQIPFDSEFCFVFFCFYSNDSKMINSLHQCQEKGLRFIHMVCQ